MVLCWNKATMSGKRKRVNSDFHEEKQVIKNLPLFSIG